MITKNAAPIVIPKKKIAVELDVSISTVNRLFAKKLLPKVQISPGKVGTTRTALVAYIESRTTPAITDAK